MNGYVAFLRGINVGGQKLMSMAKLSRAFEKLGFKNVRTYIQSGNVIFETGRANRDTLSRQIEQAMRDLFGDDVAVFLRTFQEIESIIALYPLGGKSTDTKVNLYVSFTSRKISGSPALPFFSAKKDVEIILIRDCDVFSISHEIGGKYGFPNVFIEKEFKVQATTRNWTTINKILK